MSDLFVRGVLVGVIVGILVAVVAIKVDDPYAAGYLDGQVSRTRCAHGAAARVGDAVVCVEKLPSVRP